MEKAKNVFAVLGLIWVIDILVYLIFPQTMLAWHTYGENVVYNLLGALHGSAESRIWLLMFTVAPGCFILLVVFAGIGVQSVIARVIRKARA
jgi:hypothetical protein